MRATRMGTMNRAPTSERCEHVDWTGLGSKAGVIFHGFVTGLGVGVRRGRGVGVFWCGSIVAVGTWGVKDDLGWRVGDLAVHHDYAAKHQA